MLHSWVQGPGPVLLIRLTVEAGNCWVKGVAWNWAVGDGCTTTFICSVSVHPQAEVAVKVTVQVWFAGVPFTYVCVGAWPTSVTPSPMSHT